MGCRGSKMRGCLRPRRKKRKTKTDENELDVQELTNLKDGSSSVHVGPENNNSGSQEKHQQECERLKKEQEEAAKERDAEITRRLTEQAEALRTDHESQCKELQRLHDQEKASMTEEFQTMQAALQEYGSPGQFWEQELQSLHFVIEMKNEKLHELEKKLLNLTLVMERNLSLEEKVSALQQDNENLHVQIQNHVSVTRQLSEDLQSLQEALERETLARQQVHHEKEELLYRVLNNQTLPAFQLSNVAAEVPIIAT
ncbi:coiled-coil domain-containing protein 69 isoform X2 [Pleurodeles waltl]|uniref:coiled-coil domain-containing protein 69 isoform X2 n=1 Tax=Pleurodeles waltl TaxID=8319 RepID=UPI003709697D